MERQNREFSPPLWRGPQRTASFPSAPGLRQWALVLLFSIFVLLFLPSFLSKGVRPAAGGLIKNGWDALNFLLVLSAILCGLLSRSNNSDDSPTASNSQQWLPSPSPRRSTPVQTPRSGDDGYLSQIPAFGESVQTTPVHRRLRSSSSYPDLRHDWLPAEECRFYDDMYLERRLPETRSTMATPRHTFSHLANQMPAVETTPSHSISQDKKIINETATENQSPIGRRLRSSSSYPDLRTEWVPANEWRFSDDIQLHRRQPERGSPEVKTIPVDTFKLPSSTPPSPPPPPPRRRRTTRKLPKPDPEQEPPRTPPPPRAPPPPPPPPPTPPRDPKRHQRKKSVGGAKDLASALAQFYQKKRKKSSSRSKASPDGGASPPASAGDGGGPPPPPPPPPPPSSVFNKLFTHKKSGSKAKRAHTAPPPPPPPPLRSKTQISQHSSPLPPTSPHSVRRRRDRSSQANSNLKSPPPPPPPPPSAASAAGEQGRLSCPPSPDVNNKADMFIARFRAGLELEKQNSVRAKEGQAAAPPTDDEEEMVIGTLFDD